MITPEDLKTVISKISPVLKDITENRCFSQFIFMESAPDSDCQYWKYELNFIDDYLNSVKRSCGYFMGEGQMINTEFSINRFFHNNDMIMEEFLHLTKQGMFAPILPYLKEAKKLSGIDSVKISVEAYIRGGDEWLIGVCNETILILHEHEKNDDIIDIGCQQSERYHIKISDDNRVTFLNIPFDKVNRFNHAERVEGYRKTPFFPYEVALSFAGEDRPYVSTLAHSLKQKNIRVFYDDYEKVSLWGKDLYVHLDDVYRKKARFCVIFLSEHYKNKVWTNHERASAQARAFEEKQDYILPVRMDETEIPGIRPTIGYINGRSMQPGELADLIKKKLKAIE
jgi:hypothetical protein